MSDSVAAPTSTPTPGPGPEPADVSVVIPAYRAAATIGRALAGVAAQTVRPRQVVVVDDGSDDDTAERARAMAPEMAGVALTVIRQDNAGAGAARNRGLAEATGAFVAFLDADDEWLPEKLERSLAELAAGDLTLVAHDFIRREPDGREHTVRCADLFRAAEGGSVYHGLYRRGFIGTSTVVARRQALVDAGGFDETLGTAQDFDLWLKVLADPAARLGLFDAPLARYAVTPGGITSNVERRLACTLAVARRHVPNLKRHPGSAWRSLVFRVVAVHYEAVAAYRRRGRILAALATGLRLPVNLLRAFL